jgi:hypothetical protein
MADILSFELAIFLGGTLAATFVTSACVGRPLRQVARNESAGCSADSAVGFLNGVLAAGPRWLRDAVANLFGEEVG